MRRAIPLRSRKSQLPAWLRDRAPEGLCRLDPLRDDDLRVGHGFFVGRAVGHAAGEFGHFDDEGSVGFAPINDEFVAHQSISSW